MPIFEWSEKFSVGVDAMDDQHRILVTILNELHEAMTTTKDRSAGDRLLDKLLDYTQYHFTHEEELMASAAYPGIAGHRLKHDRLCQSLRDLLVRRDDPTLNLDLMFFLRDWLKAHILVEDKTYGPWMKQHGIQ